MALAICICLGNWRTAFKPEKNSVREFHVDQATTVMVPMMTHTGQYHYLNDKVKTLTCLLLFRYIRLGCFSGLIRCHVATVQARRCTVVKMPLSQRSYMLLVLPHEGANLIDIEARLRVDVMSDWYTSIQVG